MQNVKQASKFKLLRIFSLASATLLLFSCSRSIVDVPGQDYQQVNALNQSPSAQVRSNVESGTIERILFMPCANSGAGEEIRMSGTIVNVDQIVFNDRGF